MEILETADLTSLLERIEQAPALREHHVWEAARCLSVDLRDPRSSSSARRFAELIAAGAMLDAVMLLMAISGPRRFVAEHEKRRRALVLHHSTCRRSRSKRRSATFRAEHAGPSCRAPDVASPVVSERSAAAPEAAERRHLNNNATRELSAMTPDQAKIRLNGAITALITPFHAGEVDLKGLTRLVRWQIEEGINGLVPCGTTGEAPTLSWEERLDIIGLCVRVACGRVPIIAGTGTSSTEATIGFTTAAEIAWRRRRSYRDALLQQAEPGGDIPPLRGDRPQGQNPCHRLQRPGSEPVSILLPQTIKRLAEISRDCRYQGRHRRFEPAAGDFCSRRRPLPAVLRPRSQRRSASIRWAAEGRFPWLRMWRLDCASRCTTRCRRGDLPMPQGRYITG